MKAHELACILLELPDDEVDIEFPDEQDDRSGSPIESVYVDKEHGGVIISYTKPPTEEEIRAGKEAAERSRLYREEQDRLMKTRRERYLQQQEEFRQQGGLLP